MRKTHSLLKKFLPFIAVGLCLIFVLGAISFSSEYNEKTYSLAYPSFFVCLLLFFVAATLGTCIYVSASAKNVGISRIRKNSGYMRFASAFAAGIFAVGFFCEIAELAAAPSSFGGLRLIKTFLNLPVCAYFVISMLPKEINSKRVVIPWGARVVLSVCTILWGIAGIFYVYFLKGLYTSEPSRIFEVLIYVLIAVFFLFEAEFELVYPKCRAYIFSALALCIPVCAFSLPMLFIPYKRLAIMEYFYAIALAIYAFCRIVSLVSTMRFVIELDEEKEIGSILNYTFAAESKTDADKVNLHEAQDNASAELSGKESNAGEHKSDDEN